MVRVAITAWIVETRWGNKSIPTPQMIFQSTNCSDNPSWRARPWSRSASSISASARRWRLCRQVGDYQIVFLSNNLIVEVGDDLIVEVESICSVGFNLCAQHPCVNQQSHLLPNNAFVFILASLPHIVLTTASMFTLEGGMTLLPTLLLMFGKAATNWIKKKPGLIHVNSGGDWSCCKRCQEHYFFRMFGKEPTNWPEKKPVPIHVNAAVENDLVVVFNVAKNFLMFGD